MTATLISGVISNLALVGWSILILAVGYAIGLFHCFFAHWGREKAYCPRCSYYLNWRDTLLAQLIPGWRSKKYRPDPWERREASGD